MYSFPWLTLTNIVWLQAIAGTNTDYSAYSSLLKSRLGISQLKLNNLAVASDAGKLLGWCAGVAARRFPLWTLPAIGSILGAVGYGVQYLFLSNKISSLSYSQFLFLNIVNGNSICWLNTAGYKGVMQQFLPTDHGAVIALTTSYTGLTANIYLALARFIFRMKEQSDDKSVYLLLNALTPAAISLLVMPTLAAIRGKPAYVKSGLAVMFVIALITGGYTVAKMIVPALKNSRGVLPAAMLLLMVLSVASVPVWKTGEWLTRRRDEKKGVTVGLDGDVEGGEDAVVLQVMEHFGEKNVKGVRELLKLVNFWVYFFVYLCGATLGMVYGNNLGQISESRRVSEMSMLSIYSSFGFFGRLATASLLSFSRNKSKLSNTGMIAVLMMFMPTSFFLLLFPNKACLFVSTAIIGLCSGAISSIAVLVSSELFGQENFGVNHNIVIANIPIGSFLFGSIAAIIYDRGVVNAGRTNGVCVGMECYNATFIILGCVSSFGTILSFVLYSRTRKMMERSRK